MNIDHKLGEYIYMGMGLCNSEVVNISTAYKPDYCVKKALQFQQLSRGNVVFTKMHKVRVGELTREESIPLAVLEKEYQHIFKK